MVSQLSTRYLELCPFRRISSSYRWPFSKGDARMEFEVTGPLTLNDAGLMLRAAISGMGLACTLEDNIIKELSDGRLVRVLKDWCPPSPGFFLYYPSRRQRCRADPFSSPVDRPNQIYHSTGRDPPRPVSPRTHNAIGSYR